MTERDLRDMFEGLCNKIDLLVADNDSLTQRLSAHEGKVEAMEKMLYEDIIMPAKDAMMAADRELGIEEFRGEFGEQLDPFNDPLRAIEGDDFDIVATTYDEYQSLPEPRPEAGDFVADMVSEIESQVGAIKEKLGLVGDVNIEVTEEGDVTIEDEAGNVVDENSAVEGEIEAEAVTIDESTATDTPEDIEAFEKELEEEMKNM